MNQDAELLEIFRAEVEEQLERLDRLLAGDPSAWNIEDILRLAHNVKGAARLTGTAGVMEVAHALEDLLDVVRRGGGAIAPYAVDLIRRGSKMLEPALSSTSDEMVSQIESFRRDVASAIGDDSGETAREEVAPDGIPDARPRDELEARVVDGGGTIRIRLDRLNHLMGASSELSALIHRRERQRELASEALARAERVRRRSNHVANDDDLAQLVAITRELASGLDEDRQRQRSLSDELRDAIGALRMVPLDTLRGPLRRVARDACSATGRDADVTLVGADIEVDRSVIELLRDPLTHLVRNSIAHGIEPPDERIRLGKRPAGTVTVRAAPAGSFVEIVVDDDGRGIDRDALRRRARALPSKRDRPVDALSDEEVVELVFEPGLSTAATLSEVAGRGFGMDIVKLRVEEMGGSVSVASTWGRGTEIRMRVPLTRLTTRGLVVTVAGQPMAIPVSHVERVVVVDRSTIRSVDGRDVAPISDSLIPTTSLASLLSIEPRLEIRTPAVIISDGPRSLALLVQDVVGEDEFTVQALGPELERASAVAGASVTDAGDVLLVLDPRELVRTSTHTGMEREPTTRNIAEERRYRILVVDDSVTSRTLERNILTSNGYEVVMAVHGEMALETLRAEKVDLVISDVEMPVMTGIELTRAIRASRELSSLPLILVTSRGSDADRRLGAEAGANAYVVKGEFDQDELLRAVRRLL